MIARVILSGMAVWFAAWLMQSVTVEPWWMAAVVALVLGLINALVRPIVDIFTSSINFLTLGLFTFVVNAVMVMLCAYLIPDEYFAVKGFIPAFVFSFIVTIVSTVLGIITGKR